MIEYLVSDFVVQSNIMLPDLQIRNCNEICRNIISLTYGDKEFDGITEDRVKILELCYDDLICNIYYDHSVYYVSFSKCDTKVLETVFLNKVMPAIALHCGDLVLHATACFLNGIGLIFCADSGIGKSTLGYLFHKFGAKFVSDDNVYLTTNGNGLRLNRLDNYIKLSNNIIVPPKLYRSLRKDDFSNKIQYEFICSNVNVCKIKTFVLRRWSKDNSIYVEEINDELHRETLMHRFVKGTEGCLNSFDRLLTNNVFRYLVDKTTISYLYLPKFDFLESEVSRICENGSLKSIIY